MTQKQIGLNLAALVALIVLLAGWYWQSTGARAVPALTGSLADERAKVRVMAATALAEIGPAASAAAPALLDQALRDSNLNASATAAGALAKIDLTAARQVMSASLPQLASGDADARRRACEVIASLGPVARPAVPRLVEASKDPDEVVRGRAVAALGSIGLPAAQVVPALIAALGDPAPGVRYTAVLQFSFAQVPEAAIPALTTRLGDEEKSVAGLAERALAAARQGQMANVPVLAMMLRMGSSRDYTLLQLAKLGPRAAGAVPALVPILREPRALDRYLAAEALGAIGPAAAAARPAAVVRASAARAREAGGGPRASEHAKAPR
jgi:HEAT repeat protein